MTNNTRERAYLWIVPGVLALSVSACVPDRDASLGKTDDSLEALDIDACEAAGGVATPDPGDGSLLASGCPDGATLGPIADQSWDEGGLCCKGEPPAPGTGLTVEECEAAGGEALTDPGDGSLHAQGCPDGRENLGSIDEQGWIEGGLCCKPADVAPTTGLTVAECEAAGGEALSDPGDGSLHDQGCPHGRENLGSIDEESWDEGGLCCEAVKPAPTTSFTVAECEAAGGDPTADPGDGSLFQDGCPYGADTLGTIDEASWIEGGLCCSPAATLTGAQCEAAGGISRPDPGDGSLLDSGCPDAEITLGMVFEEGWDEGGLCCKAP